MSDVKLVKRARWKFQLLPSVKGALAVGYRMDAVGEKFENEVNDAFPYPFRFHKVNKIVVCLGSSDECIDYKESLGVGTKYWPDFDLEKYRLMDDQSKVASLRAILLKTFSWLESSFADAQFIAKARMRLSWAGVRD